MFICKVCQHTFEMVHRIPQIMKCGHTFCKLCILHSIETKGYFPCQNCFFKLKDVDQLIINQILCDRSSFQENQNQTIEDEIKSKIAQAFYVQKKNSMNKNMTVEDAIEEQFFDSMRMPQGSSKRKIDYSNKCLHQSCNRHAERDYCSITCQQNHTSPRNQINNQRDFLRTTKPQTRFGQSCLFDNNFTKSKNLSVFVPNFNQSKSKFGGRNFLSKSKNRQKCLRNGCNNWRRNDGDEQTEFCGEICQIRYQTEYSQLTQLIHKNKTQV